MEKIAIGLIDPNGHFDMQKAVENHFNFIMMELQPLMRETVRAISSSVEPNLTGMQTTVPIVSDHAVPARLLNVNIGHEFLNILIDAQSRRLNQRYGWIKSNDAIFSKTVEECLDFDSLLKTKYNFGAYYDKLLKGQSYFQFVSWKVFSKG